MKWEPTQWCAHLPDGHALIDAEEDRRGKTTYTWSITTGECKASGIAPTKASAIAACEAVVKTMPEPAPKETN